MNRTISGFLATVKTKTWVMLDTPSENWVPEIWDTMELAKKRISLPRWSSTTTEGATFTEVDEDDIAGLKIKSKHHYKTHYDWRGRKEVAGV